MSVGTRMLAVVVCGLVAVNAVTSVAQEPKKALGVSVTGGAIFTDNRDSTADGEDNTDLFISPRIDVSPVQSETAMLDFFYAPRYRWRSDPSSIQNEDEWQHDLSLTGMMRLSDNTAVRARERFNYTDDPDITEGGVTTRRESSYILNRLNAGISHDVTPRMNLDLAGAHMMKAYDDDIYADRSDETVASAELSARQRMGDTLTGVLMAGVESVDNEVVDGIERGFDTYYGGVGVDKRFSEVLSANALIGVQGAEYDDGMIDSETAPMVRASVSALLAQNTSLYLQGTYRIDNAYSYPFTSQRHTSGFARLSHAASQKLSMSAFFEYRLEDYDSDNVSPLTPDSAFFAAREGDETTILAAASASYRLLDKTTVTVGYTYEDVDSDVYVSFDRSAGTVTVTQEF